MDGKVGKTPDEIKSMKVKNVTKLIQQYQMKKNLHHLLLLVLKTIFQQ